MEIQRSEGIFKEEFELDKASIQSLTHSSAGPTDLQPSHAGPSIRIMPASMRSTHTPPSGGQPARNSGSFQVGCCGLQACLSLSLSLSFSVHFVIPQGC